MVHAGGTNRQNDLPPAQVVDFAARMIFLLIRLNASVDLLMNWRVWALCQVPSGACGGTSSRWRDEVLFSGVGKTKGGDAFSACLEFAEGVGQFRDLSPQKFLHFCEACSVAWTGYKVVLLEWVVAQMVELIGVGVVGELPSRPG